MPGTYVDDARYLSEVSWAGQPTPFWQPPLYPYLLGLLFSVGGENYYLPRLLQVLFGALICGLTYLLGLRLFPPAVALGAGLAAACYGPLIYFGGELSAHHPGPPPRLGSAALAAHRSPKAALAVAARRFYTGASRPSSVQYPPLRAGIARLALVFPGELCPARGLVAPRHRAGYRPGCAAQLPSRR